MVKWSLSQLVIELVSYQVN